MTTGRTADPQHLASVLLEPSHRVALLGLDYVDQVVADPRPLSGRSRLGGADVHPAVDLHRVDRSTDVAQFLGQPQGDIALPRGGGADDGERGSGLAGPAEVVRRRPHHGYLEEAPGVEPTLDVEQLAASGPGRRHLRVLARRSLDHHLQPPAHQPSVALQGDPALQRDQPVESLLADLRWHLRRRSWPPPPCRAGARTGT